MGKSCHSPLSSKREKRNVLSSLFIEKKKNAEKRIDVGSFWVDRHSLGIDDSRDPFFFKVSIASNLVSEENTLDF